MKKFVLVSLLFPLAPLCQCQLCIVNPTKKKYVDLHDHLHLHYTSTSASVSASASIIDLDLDVYDVAAQPHCAT